MQRNLFGLLILAFVITAQVAAPTSAAAQSSARGNQPPDAAADRFFAEVRQLYETAGSPQLINDAPGRLAIYRAVLRRFDAASPAIRADSRFTRNHLFYRVALAATLGDAGDSAGGLRETDQLLPLLRAHVSGHRDDAMMTEALARLLRLKGEFLGRSGYTRAALPYFRETVAISERLMAANAFPDPAYGARSLAIDLDNLANVEAQLGNAAEADSASLRALDLFRQLAAQSPDSRPAQGSLLIALVRRAVNFREISRLNEAEQQIAVMRGRGFLEGRYREIADQLPAIRNSVAQRPPR